MLVPAKDGVLKGWEDVQTPTNRTEGDLMTSFTLIIIAITTTTTTTFISRCPGRGSGRTHEAAVFAMRSQKRQ